MAMHEHLMHFIENTPDPGHVRHIAILPEERKGFIFMFPEEGKVANHLGPVYRHMVDIFRDGYH
jgi:hypothetical protein